MLASLQRFAMQTLGGWSDCLVSQRCILSFSSVVSVFFFFSVKYRERRKRNGE